MRYISDLLTDVGPVPSIDYIVPPGWVPTHPLVSAVIHDDESDSDLTVKPGRLSTELCLGNATNEGVAVRYTQKTAKLFDYVYGVSSCACEPVVDLSAVDYCSSAYPGRVIGRHKELAIDTGEGAIQFAGLLGSVVHKKSRFEVTASHMTLYELLGRLCRSYGLNIMQYEAVHLYSEVECYKADIRFVHNEKADRFFTKMYLDVVG